MDWLSSRGPAKSEICCLGCCAAADCYPLQEFFSLGMSWGAGLGLLIRLEGPSCQASPTYRIVCPRFGFVRVTLRLVQVLPKLPVGTSVELDAESQVEATSAMEERGLVPVGWCALSNHSNSVCLIPPLVAQRSIR
jgi:hypothetical protein